MTMTDPISDLLTRIRNAIAAKHDAVEVPASKMKLELVRILKDEGYIESYVVVRDNRQGRIRIALKYTAAKEPVIGSLNRISRPGCRVYARKSEIPSVLGGLGLCILSTSRGIMTGEQARQQGLGGEVLCSIS
ncbi:MAG: 30S ribosomal protein S8 [Acidobacteria bacterium]|nr:30S ribosomal protein S8 [Acidobacteriota bacterium]